MLHFFRFSSEVPAPVPAREVYGKVPPGQGWPSQCPPIRAASAFGWDVLSAFPLDFRREADGSWTLENPVDLESDWAWSAEARSAHGHDVAGCPVPAAATGAGEDLDEQPETDDEEDDDEAPEGVTLVQRNAWFWERGQTLPHPISDHVFEAIKNQVKVSTYLFLATDENECLLITDVPNQKRPWRALTALVDTDWYPASYPWHCVLELDPLHERIQIPAGEPICRLLPVARGTWFAREMDDEAFDAFFRRGQAWLAAHGKGEPGEMMDVRGAYAQQQVRSRFVVGP